ncbi:N-acetylglucosamine 6-O-sulfotransferase activity protein [Homalodisca vitripennis]|nr:N-acetylglucosamine 6-O-sulfotransferase activity protein [Homalodisca vitripennis]
MIQRATITNTTKLAIVIVFVFTLKLYSMRSSFPKINYCTEETLTTTTALPRNLTEKEFLEKGFDPNQNLDIDEDAEIHDEITDEMKKVIDELRIQIKKETKGYKLPSFREIEDLIPEKGGTPMRSLVITTWRSGSTFIGGVLNSHPGTFHFSEPLTDYRTVQIRGEPLGSPAVRALRSLLTCNYHVLERYLERSKDYTWLFTHNTRLWQHCVKHKDFCWLPQFLKPVCRLFPFQSMKVVHIRLRLVEEMLADPELNVRVVLLVRDPRGIMESRSTLSWCKAHQDCGNPVRVCADLVDDYSAAMRFKALFPDKFRVVRYEDMSLKPHKVIPDIFRFFGLQYHPEVEQFVNNHTTRVDSNRYSTFRNSTDVALSWRRKSEYAKVEELQRICRVAMSAWGYLPAYNASHQQTFNPLAELGL